jgi:hypothetical protein
MKDDELHIDTLAIHAIAFASWSSLIDRSATPTVTSSTSRRSP